MIEFVLIFCYLSLIYSIEEISRESSVYNIMLDNKYLQSKNGNKLQISSSEKYEEKSNFRFKQIYNSVYNIEHVKTQQLLIADPPDVKLVQKTKTNSNTTLLSDWTFILQYENKYIIQNTNTECYIVYEDSKLKCKNIEDNDATIFTFIKIYDEVNNNNALDLEILEKEPVDVAIKYIDLSDPNLKREGIPQIKKDEDHQELKYCVRSIIKNLPWVRKIFIIMPNAKVKYFKDYELISDKIVYVNDKEFLGFDSSNSCTFQFNLWNLAKFNASQNIILMDDDYFIGKPLLKSDFFYVENGKVLPSIVATIYNEETNNSIIKNYNYNRDYARRTNGTQTPEEFWYTVYNTYSFIYKKLNKTLIAPRFTHNAIPCNLNDVKEIYNLINNSEYRNTTLTSIFRGIETLQFQSFYMTYIFNKYHRKVSPISHKFIELNSAITEMYDDYSLFCINTGSKKYSQLSYDFLRITLEKNFPEPSPYEIIEYSFPTMAFDIISKLYNKLFIFEILTIIVASISIISFISFTIYCRKKHIPIIKEETPSVPPNPKEKDGFNKQSKGPFLLMDIK